MVEKSQKLFDTIPKTRKTVSNKNDKQGRVDIKKETIHFMRTIDQARLRSYCIDDLLSYEIIPTSFYLTKDNYLRKGTKSELGKELKSLVNNYSPNNLSINDNNSMLVVDFMGYARKIPVKK